MILLAAIAGPARADCPPCTDAGRRGTQCPPWSVCSVYTGECGSGQAPLSVCTGRCRAGSVTRVVALVGAYQELGDEGDRGLAVAVEVVPPVAAGHLALRAGWRSGGVLSAGPVVSWPLGRGLVVGAGLDVARGAGAWAGGASARLELFPWALGPDWIPAQLTSLILEVGSLAPLAEPTTRQHRVVAGLRVWL